MTTPDITEISVGIYSAGAFGVLAPPGQDTFILAEDQALRDLLKGVVVSDSNNQTRPVGVWFGQPDPELRQQSYPYITIDLLNVAENRDQVMDRYGPLDTAHSVLHPETNTVAVRTFSPTPMLLTYQISSWSRNPRHDRQIISAMMHSKLHPRFAQITTAGDNVSRRLVVLSFNKRDTTDENQKRLFRNIWTIQVVSELFYAPLDLIRKTTAVSINSAAVVPVRPADFPPPPPGVVIRYPR